MKIPIHKLIDERFWKHRVLAGLLGAGTPREWKNRFGRLVLTLYYSSRVG